MKRFGLIGASGFIAPRHMKAINDTGNTLIAALDPFDSVGILDSYFPNADFFTQDHAFEAFADDQRRVGNGLEIISVCSPNYLHDAHIRMALRVGADALCEKPIVLEPDQIDQLRDLEANSGKRVWTVLQLRTHAALVQLKSELEGDKSVKDVNLSYVTSRGKWYLKSWKGKLEQSGGLASNIGVHFFDMLIWLFGSIVHVEVHERSDTVCAGFIELERARVRWFLSIDPSFIPKDLSAKNQRTYRSITIDGTELEFSEGFTDLHTDVYRRTLAGNGFSLLDTRGAIETVAQIRKASITVPQNATAHPFLGRA